MSSSTTSSTTSSTAVKKGGQTMSSSAAVVENGKRGLLAKIERMNGYFGGWHSLLRGRNGRNKRLKRESKLASFGREFRGRLMLEPLEERIVPAIVSLLPGDALLFNVTAGADGASYGIIANDAASLGNISVDITGTLGTLAVDTINSIKLDTTAAGPQGIIIHTNVGVSLLDDSLMAAGQAANLTLHTGEIFGIDPTLGNSVVQVVNAHAATYTIAGANNYSEILDAGGVGDQLDKVAEVTKHSSNIGTIDVNNVGTTNITAITTAAAGADAGDLTSLSTTGDITAITVAGNLGALSASDPAGAILGAVTITEGARSFTTAGTGADKYNIVTADFGDAGNIALTIYDTDTSGAVIVNTTSGSFGSSGSILSATAGADLTVTIGNDAAWTANTVGTVTTTETGTSNDADLLSATIEDGSASFVIHGKVLGSITGTAGSLGSITADGDIGNGGDSITAVATIGSITSNDGLITLVNVTAPTGVGAITAASSITITTLTAASGNVGVVTANAGSITGGVWGADSFSGLTATGATSDISLTSLTADNGNIGGISAGRDIIVPTITANFASSTIGAITAGRDLDATTISAADGVGAITVTRDILIGLTINGNLDAVADAGSIGAISAGGEIAGLTLTNAGAATTATIGAIQGGNKTLVIENITAAGSVGLISSIATQTEGTDGDVVVKQATIAGDLAGITSVVGDITLAGSGAIAITGNITGSITSGGGLLGGTDATDDDITVAAAGLTVGTGLAAATGGDIAGGINAGLADVILTGTVTVSKVLPGTFDITGGNVRYRFDRTVGNFSVVEGGTYNGAGAGTGTAAIVLDFPDTPTGVFSVTTVNATTLADVVMPSDLSITGITSNGIAGVPGSPDMDKILLEANLTGNIGSALERIGDTNLIFVEGTVAGNTVFIDSLGSFAWGGGGAAPTFNILTPTLTNITTPTTLTPGLDGGTLSMLFTTNILDPLAEVITVTDTTGGVIAHVTIASISGATATLGAIGIDGGISLLSIDDNNLLNATTNRATPFTVGAITGNAPIVTIAIEGSVASITTDDAVATTSAAGITNIILGYSASAPANTAFANKIYVGGKSYDDITATRPYDGSNIGAITVDGSLGSVQITGSITGDVIVKDQDTRAAASGGVATTLGSIYAEDNIVGNIIVGSPDGTIAGITGLTLTPVDASRGGITGNLVAGYDGTGAFTAGGVAGSKSIIAAGTIGDATTDRIVSAGNMDANVIAKGGVVDVLLTKGIYSTIDATGYNTGTTLPTFVSGLVSPAYTATLLTTVWTDNNGRVTAATGGSLNGYVLAGPDIVGNIIVIGNINAPIVADNTGVGADTGGITGNIVAIGGNIATSAPIIASDLISGTIAAGVDILAPIIAGFENVGGSVAAGREGDITSTIIAGRHIGDGTTMVALGGAAPIPTQLQGKTVLSGSIITGSLPGADNILGTSDDVTVDWDSVTAGTQGLSSITGSIGTGRGPDFVITGTDNVSGNINGNILATGNISAAIDAGAGVGGSILADIRAGRNGLDVTTIKDDLSSAITADEAIGKADGSNDISAGGNIAGASINSGLGTGLSGNINVDILAGYQYAGGTADFDGTGNINVLTVQADGNIGIAAGTNQIAAAGSITSLTVIADGNGNTATAANQNVYVDINAGVQTTLSRPTTDNITTLVVTADGSVGAVGEGFNVIRADGSITGATITAGMGDADTTVTENFLMNVFAGLEKAGTLVTGAGVGALGGDIVTLVIYADDNIGATDVAAETDGIKAAGDIKTNVNIAAGTGSFGGTGDTGGSILMDIVAGFSGTGSIKGAVVIEADDNVGQTGEGTNVIYAATDIGALVGLPGGTVAGNWTPASLATAGFDVAIDAGNPTAQADTTTTHTSNVFTDVIAFGGNIIDLVITADDNIGSTGQTLGSATTATMTTPTVAGTITVSVTADQIDSDGLGSADNPQGIIQAGDYMEGLTIVAGEYSVNANATQLTGGNVLVSIIAGADGTESGAAVTVRDLVNDNGTPKLNAQSSHTSFDGIDGLVLIADNDLGDASGGATTGRGGNIISAADSIDITTMIAGNNLKVAGLDPNNTVTALPSLQPDSAGDVSFDIIAGTRLFGPTGSNPATKGGVTITSGPSIVADSGLPFALDIKDSNLPGPDTMYDDKLYNGNGDQITILNLDIATGGIFVPDLSSTTATQEGNGNLNGTFVAGSDLTVIGADINGSLVGNNGTPGGRTMIAGASSSLNSNGNFLTVQLTMPGVFTGPFTAGTVVPFDMDSSSFIGTNAGPFQAGTVITKGTIQGEIQAGRFDGTGNGITGSNGITLEEVLAGTEGLADSGFVPTTTFGATGDIKLDLYAAGRPYTAPQTSTGAENPDYGDGDFVNFSMYAMGNITNDTFFAGGSVDDPKVAGAANFTLTSNLASGITAEDAMNINFILANADAITAIDSASGDPSTPSTLLPRNSAYGDLSVNITSRGMGDGAEGATGTPSGISGGPIAAGFDPFVLIDTTVLPANKPAGSVLQDPIVPANAYGSRYANAFGLGDISSNIYALDLDATDGLEQGDITVTWIAAGEDITGNIAAQDDIALAADASTGALLPGVDLDIAAGLSSNGLIAAFGVSGEDDKDNIATLFPGGDIDGDIIAGDDIYTTDAAGDDAGLISIMAQGGKTKGNIGGDIVSGAEDQVDNEVFVTPVGTLDTTTGGGGANINALIIASVDVDGSILAGDPFGAFDSFFSGVGGGGLPSNEAGAYYGSFTGTVVAGAGVDMIINNFSLASTYNLDNKLLDGDINEISADSDVTLRDYSISSLSIVLNGAIAVHNIGDISAGWGDPVATGVITGDITAGNDIDTIIASKRIGSAGDLIAAGHNIDLIQAGDPSSADKDSVPTSAPFDIPLIDSVGTVAANIFTGGTLDTILAGGGKGAQLTDTGTGSENNNGITGNLFLGEFTGQGDLKFGEAGQVAALNFNDDKDANIVEIPSGDLSASLDMILTDGGESAGKGKSATSGVDGFTLTFDGTATGLPFSIDELIVADDLMANIVVDQGSIGRLVIDDDAIDRLVAGENARDAFNTKIPLPNMPAIFFQLYDGDLSRTPMSRQFNEDAATNVATVDYADMAANIIVRDSIGLGPAVGTDPYGVVIEGSMRGNAVTLQSLLGNIGNIYVGTDIQDANIYANRGSIGDIFVGDDMSGMSGGVDIIADLGIGDIEVQDSIIGDVWIQAISGSIGNITVGTAVDAIGDPVNDSSLTDADGLGIDGNGTSGGIDILARDNIGDITVIHGNITDDVNIETDVSYFGDIGDIAVYHGNISDDVNIEADGNVGNIFVGVLPGVDGLLGTPDDVILKNDFSIGEISDDVGIFARIGGIGNITVANDMEGDVEIGASVGGIGQIRVYDDLQDEIDIWTASGSGGGLGGLFVGGDIKGSSGSGGVDIDIDGAINALTQSTVIGSVTGAVLVGGSILGNVSIQAASIGAAGNALVVGINGVGNINPGTQNISIVAKGANGNIGNITVRDKIGSGSITEPVIMAGNDGDADSIAAGGDLQETPVGAKGLAPDTVVVGPGTDGVLTSTVAAGDVLGTRVLDGGGDVLIASWDGSIGNIVAGGIYSAGTGETIITAEKAIGDIVTLDDALGGIANATLRVHSATGTIGDIIAHGSITNLTFIRFDGSIGDVVSLNGSVTLTGLTLGGSMGDIYASEDIDLNDIRLEAGSLGDDGVMSPTKTAVTDTSINKADPTLAYNSTLGTWTVNDGLNRARPDGAPADGITSQIGSVTIHADTRIAGNVGPISAFEDVSLGYIEVGGNIGGITSINAEVLIAQSGEFQVGGNVGNIEAFLRVAIGNGTSPDLVNIGGNLGSVTSLASRVEIKNIDVLGNVGDISAFQLVQISDMDVGGNVGNITSLNDNISIIGDTEIVGNIGNITAFANVGISNLSINGNIGNIYAGDGVDISETLIGGNVGNITGITQSGIGVNMDSVHVRGNVGNVIGDVGGDGGEGISLDEVVVDGSVGNMTGTSEDDYGIYWYDVLVQGNVGNISGTSIDDSGIYIDGAYVGGLVGNITGSSAEGEGVFIENIKVVGNVGNITGDAEGDDGVELTNWLVDGSVGNITGSSQGDLAIDIEGVSVVGNIGNITSPAGGIGIDTINIGGNIGNIRANTGYIDINNADVAGSIAKLGSIRAFDYVNLQDMNVGGDIGDITSDTQYINLGGGSGVFHVAGNVGNITGEYYVEMSYVGVGGNVGNITSKFGYIDIGGNVEVVGNVGNISAFLDLTLGNSSASGGGDSGGADYGLAIGGNLGTAVSLKGDITADLVVDGNIADIYAAEGDIYCATIVSGGNIGSFASGTGVRAGNFIWDDVTIVAKGTIGVVEARVLGFSLVYSTSYDTLADDTDGILDGVNDILLPDNDHVFDFQNDYLVFMDSNGDNIIEISPIIQAYMVAEDGDSALLDDGKIDSQEALAIIQWLGTQLPDIADPDNAVMIADIFQNVFKEVEVIDVDDVVDVPDVVTTDETSPNEDVLIIIAEGIDPSATVRAIGRISSTLMTSSDLFVDAAKGGIGELSSGGILGLTDAYVTEHGVTFVTAGGVTGDVGAGDTLANAVIRAKTSIDTIRGDDAIINLDIQVTGGITIDPTKPLDQMITTTGGVGLVGGIVSAGDIEIKVVTGGSIGYTATTGGSINNNYDAFGNIGSIIAKDNISGTYVAAQGIIGNAITLTGQARFVSGGVLAASGDISADFKAGLGAGNISAPLGNVSGTLVTGGVVKGVDSDYVIESSVADDDDFEITLSTAALKTYRVYTTLDTDSGTAFAASMTFTNSDGNSQIVNVTGSASDLRVKVGVAFGFVTDATITGSGSLTFDSTGDIGGVMTVGYGAKVSVSSINVEGDFGGFININKNAKVANITATEDIGQVIGYGLVQNITAGEDIGEVKSLFKDVKNVFAGEDIDKIFATGNVQNIGAQDRIGEIIAGKNVKIVHAFEIGTISAANVSKVYAIGDIDLISASVNVTDVSSSGDIEVVAGRNATRIAGADGTVSVGAKASKVSYNLDIIAPPKVPVVFVDPPTV